MADCPTRIVDPGLDNVTIFVDVFRDVEDREGRGDLDENGGVCGVGALANMTTESKGDR